MNVRAQVDVKLVELPTVENPLPVAYCVLLHFELVYFCHMHYYKEDKNSDSVMHRHHHPCKRKFLFVW